MGKRTDLHELLCTILGSRNCYFQPPESLKLQYPCIVYKLDSGDTKFADNQPYMITKRYQVIVIDKNPDSLIPDRIARQPRCVYDRPYMADNLNHWSFNLYY